MSNFADGQADQPVLPGREARVGKPARQMRQQPVRKHVLDENRRAHRRTLGEQSKVARRCRSRPAEAGSSRPGVLADPARPESRNGPSSSRRSASGTFMKTSPRTWAKLASAAGSPLAASVSVRKKWAYSPVLAGVSRSASTETNSTRGRIETGIASQDFCALASSASVVGQTSGQCVKPRKTMVQCAAQRGGRRFLAIRERQAVGREFTRRRDQLHALELSGRYGGSCSGCGRNSAAP